MNRKSFKFIFIAGETVGRNNSTAGFTLVELLIVMGIGALVMVGVMSTFTTQHKTYIIQDEVVEAQQNLRVAMDMISGDLRSAGYNPSGIVTGLGIVTATAGRLGLTQDLNGNGVTTDTDEAVTYGLQVADDAGADGIADSGIGNLGRNTGSSDGTGGSGFQLLAENIYGVEFLYILEGGARKLAPSNSELELIRSVVVSILAVSNIPDESFTNSMTYTTGSGTTWGPFNDNLRRRLLVSTIKCRNLGL